MQIINYPFIKTGEADSRPALFIRLNSASTGCFQDTTGLIDTGASGICVPIGYAEILSLNPSSGVPRLVRTANGTSTAHELNIGIKVWDTHEYYKGKKVLVYEKTDIPVLFMPGLTDILLGVSFLNDKVLSINYDRKVFSLNGK